MALSVGLWMCLPAFAQEQKATPKGTAEMKGMHEEMKADIKAMDEKLDKLVVDMNAALTPDKKLDAVIAVVNEMVAQRKKMHETMAQCWMKHYKWGAEEKKGG